MTLKAQRHEQDAARPGGRPLPGGAPDACKENGTPNDLMERLFSTTNFLIAHMDRDFNFLRVNEAYARVEGRPTEFFTGKNHFALYPDGGNEAIFRRVVRTGEAFTAYAKPFRYAAHPERGTTWWDWNLWPVKDGAGRVDGVLLCLVDVTPRKLAEDELHRTQKALAEAKRLSDIGVLASTIAHEIRSPLAAIRAAVYNVRRKAKDPSLESHLATIDKKVLESDQIVRNLLSYSRLKAPLCENFAVAAALDDCVAALGRKYPKWDIELKKNISLKDTDTLSADPFQFRTLVQNLLDNACQALPHRKGTVTVEAARAGGSLSLRISDTGCGMPEEELGRVFEPFFTKKPKGIGLGLPLCRQIVAMHGGSLEIRSAEGAGTTVSVTIPEKRRAHG